MAAESNAERRTPADPMDYPCPVCRAKPGEICVNTVMVGKPLPGRESHYGRVER